MRMASAEWKRTSRAGAFRTRRTGLAYRNRPRRDTPPGRLSRHGCRTSSWSSSFFCGATSRFKTSSTWATVAVHWPALHNLILRTPPVLLKASPYPAVFNLNLISAGGTSCMFASILSAIFLRMHVADFASGDRRIRAAVGADYPHHCGRPFDRLRHELLAAPPGPWAWPSRRPAPRFRSSAHSSAGWAFSSPAPTLHRTRCLAACNRSPPSGLDSAAS